jgi:hypothetical protein
MTTEESGGSQLTEEELRAAYEAEIKKIRVEQVLLEHVVTTINLGMRRTGLAPGTEGERDPAQVRLAVESVRALLPVIEQSSPGQAKPIRDALSQLQLAYVRIGGQPAPPAGADTDGPEGEREKPATEQPKPGEPGPAQRSGRLWVPGQ